MGRIGPSYLLKFGAHPSGETKDLDIGGMLHKTLQLVGDIDDAIVDVFATLDPDTAKGGRDPSWSAIVRLSTTDPYKHHVGYVRWLRAQVVQSSDDSRFGLVLMGED
jgi:hypothetical protein